MISKTVVKLSSTHRLIPARYSPDETVLADLADQPDEINELIELDGATNARILGESAFLPGIGIHELIFGVPYANIVNASFTHASPLGGRFNDSTRGAWYAAMAIETSLLEVGFHRRHELEEIQWPEDEVSTYDDYQADFASEFHDLRGGKPAFRKYLKAAPVPQCYAESQQLAHQLLTQGSGGVLYPSVRHVAGTCIACFRPALVYNVIRGERYEFRINAGKALDPSQARTVRIH